MNEKLLVSKSGILTYAYDTGADGPAFRFNLLCEVGAPYQSWFTEELKRRRFRVKTIELPHEPWLVDVVASLWRRRGKDKGESEIRYELEGSLIDADELEDT